MDRIDAHCHFWELGRGDYTWLDQGDPDLAPIARDFKTGDIAPLLRAADVDGVVVIQAAASEAETDYLLDLAERHDMIAGVVGWVDMESEGARSRLEEWATHAKFKGIRPMLQDIEDTDWLRERPHADALAALKELGLRFDALVEPRHLPVILQFCRSNPDILVVIDHAAKPKAALAGDDDAFGYWSTHMRALADDTSACCKLSGLLTELDAAKAQDAQGLLQPYVDVLLDAFGPDRLMWGSDWPVVTLASDYGSWHDLAKAMLGHIEPTARAKVLGSTATAFYGLGVAP